MRRLTLTLILLLGASSTFAGDGRLEISQSMVPYTITNSGSYLLTENLTVTGNTAAITIVANDVTVDLNGFGIAGNKTGAQQDGIYAQFRKGLSVRNGFVKNVGRTGVNLDVCTNTVVQYIQALDNAGYGIYMGSGIADRNTCTDNDIGLFLDSGAIIYNSCQDNSSYGIVATKGAMIKNNSVGNSLIGAISVTDGALIENNTCFGSGHNAWGIPGFGSGIDVNGSGNQIYGNTFKDNKHAVSMGVWTPSTNLCAKNLGLGNDTNIWIGGGSACVTGTHGNVNTWLP